MKSLSQTRPSGYALKFSAPFAISMALTRGKAGIDEFEEHNYRNKQVLELASKVKITGYESSEYPKHLPGWLIIRMKNGTTYEHRIKFERGCLENPIPEEDIRAKYYDNASRGVSAEKVREIEKRVDDLENVGNIADLIRLCY